MNERMKEKERTEREREREKLLQPVCDTGYVDWLNVFTRIWHWQQCKYMGLKALLNFFLSICVCVSAVYFVTVIHVK